MADDKAAGDNQLVKESAKIKVQRFNQKRWIAENRRKNERSKALDNWWQKS